MRTLTLKNQVGSLIGPLPTRDSIDESRFGNMAVAEIQLALDLDVADMTRVRGIISKYVPNGTRLGDALDAGRAGREAGAKVRREMEHNAAVANARVEFWNKIDDEFHRCGQR